MAVEQRRPEAVVHHSDQGCQYTSLAFGARCRKWGVALSRGSVGDCFDNAMAESFFATLECELLDRTRLSTHAEARVAIFDFVEGWYNTRRRHSALGYMSPLEFERLHEANPVDVDRPVEALQAPTILVHLGRTPAARLPAIACTGPPSGTPAAPLRSVLGKGSRLPEARAARGIELLLEQFTVALPAIPVAVDLRQVPAQPRDLPVLLLDARVPRIILTLGRVRTLGHTPLVGTGAPNLQSLNADLRRDPLNDRRGAGTDARREEGQDAFLWTPSSQDTEPPGNPVRFTFRLLEI